MYDDRSFSFDKLSQFDQIFARLGVNFLRNSPKSNNSIDV